LKSSKPTSDVRSVRSICICTWEPIITNGALQIDWDTIAKDLGYDNVTSAKKYLSKLKIKHGVGRGSQSGGDSASKVTKKRAEKSKEQSPAKKDRADM
jgi:hypothetical protein